MRHRVAGRKLGRVTSHRLATLRNMTTSLFQRDRIRTTLMKAKEVRPFAEKLVTLSKKGGLNRRRLAARHIQDPKVLKRLFDDISPRYAERQGGYTRILKLGQRQGDRAEMAILELVDVEVAKAGSSDKAGSGKAAKPAPKKKTAAKASSKKGS